MTKFIPDYIKTIFFTTTFRQSAITFSGTFLNALFGAIFYIVVARFLGPSSFGLFSVAIVSLNFIADVSELGTGTGLVNFVSRSIKSNLDRANKFLKLALKVKFIVWVFVFVLGFVTASFWSKNLLHKPELLSAFKIVAFGIGPLILFTFVLHALQAQQKFKDWSVIQVSLNVLRLSMLVLLFWLGFLTIENTLLIYIAVPALGFLFGLRYLPKGLFNAKDEMSIAKEFFTYNKWVALFSMIAALSSRLDIFISARLLTSVDLGYYSAAQQMVKIVPQIVVALGTVIAPKMAVQKGILELKSYIKKTQALVIGLSFLGLLCIPFVLFLIPFLFGPEYVPSGSIFIILLLAMLTFLISLPIHNAVIYYFSYPKLFFYVSIGHLLLVGSLGWYLTQRYGVYGMAFSVLAGSFLNFIIPFVWVLKKIRTT